MCTASGKCRLSLSDGYPVRSSDPAGFYVFGKTCIVRLVYLFTTGVSYNKNPYNGRFGFRDQRVEGKTLQIEQIKF